MSSHNIAISHFVFWQNIISPHQSAFISELAKLASVTLVVERAMDEERIAQKWEVPIIEGVEIVIAPSSIQVEKLLEQESVQVFSGIDAYPMVYAAFKRAVKKKCWIAVLAEPYRWLGVKGWLRKLKYQWLASRYNQSIHALFATGNTGIRCFLQAGFSPEKIQPWGYFIPFPQQEPPSSDSTTATKILFVGRLDQNKNILGLLGALDKCQEVGWTLTIIGTGEYLPIIEQKIGRRSHLKLLGNLPNKEVQALMQEHDLLVLPSHYDGWGAVVNEALMNGMRVIASENCGSSVLLDDIQRGEIFFFDKSPTLREVLDKWIKKGCLTINERNEIRLWAEKSISGKVAAQYFLDKIQFLRGFNSQDIQAPWIKYL